MARRLPGTLPAKTRTVRRAVFVPPAIDGAASSTVKLSVNVSEEVGLRLRHVAFEQRLSESSIVEVALAMLFRRNDAATLGALLRQHGATLRRKRKRS
ncbi:MAG: hypothetical protein JO359_00450 [Candidatus Eremiobacteraeota bacterium]|nr:hypothetical protein [Candidatus Eremiobacteraeota bacterium]